MTGGAGTADLVVVGAGTMGVWTALRAIESGRRVVLVDQFGPGDPRATSGDESRVLRFSHGADAFYAGWARDSLADWEALGDATGERLFEPAGVAWLAHREDGFEAASEATLRGLDIPVERLTPDDAAARWPALSAANLAFVLHEPGAGALRARQAIRAAARRFVELGGEIRVDRARLGGAAGGRLDEVVTGTGERVVADRFVLAAGPWLARLVPELDPGLIAVTRQDVFYLGPEPGDRRFEAGRLPVWIDYDRAYYGIPAIDGRGAKVAPDAYGGPFDPDTADRLPDLDALDATRRYLAERLPGIADRPLVESRVCQYESTPDTHFVIDRHPRYENVWLAGGGSGHAFKHGPAIGRHLVALVDGAADAAGPPDDRFSLPRDRSSRARLRSGSDSARPLPPTR